MKNLIATSIAILLVAGTAWGQSTDQEALDGYRRGCQDCYVRNAYPCYSCEEYTKLYEKINCKWEFKEVKIGESYGIDWVQDSTRFAEHEYTGKFPWKALRIILKRKVCE